MCTLAPSKYPLWEHQPIQSLAARCLFQHNRVCRQEKKRCLWVYLLWLSTLPTHCTSVVRVLLLCSVFLLPFCLHTRPYKVWYCTVVSISEEWEVLFWLVRQQYHRTLLRTMNKSWKDSAWTKYAAPRSLQCSVRFSIALCGLFPILNLAYVLIATCGTSHLAFTCLLRCVVLNTVSMWLIFSCAMENCKRASKFNLIWSLLKGHWSKFVKILFHTVLWASSRAVQEV